MNIMKISEELKTSINVAFIAGDAIMKIYNEDFDVEIKENNSPLTIADKTAHYIINKTLNKFNLPILSEEGELLSFELRKYWNRFWMIDPIDGTKEYISKNGEFTINIALIENGHPVMGVVFAPALKELYFAESGLGSYKVENIKSMKDFKFSNFIDLTKSKYPKIYTLVVSKSHMNDKTQDYVNLLKNKHGNISTKAFGSSLKICKVAEGNAHCYPRFGPTMEWDTAAAHAVAYYSGCKILQADKKTIIKYNKKNLLNPFFIVSHE